MTKRLRPARQKMIHPGIGDKRTGATALYRLYDANGQILYVGISRNPAWRWGAHAEQHPWWLDVDSFDVEWHPSRAAAEAAEKHAILTERPARNVTHTPKHSQRILAAIARTKPPTE